MAEASEFASHPRLRHQRSLSASTSTPCCSSRICFIAGRRRGTSLADFEFGELISDCKGFFGVEPARKGNNGGNDDSNDDEDDGDDLHYKMPSRWKLFCRKVKAEARRSIRRARPMAPHFHYDALSYAMNFDNGNASMQQWQDESGMPMCAHSSRFAGPVVPSAARTWPLGASAPETLTGGFPAIEGPLSYVDQSVMTNNKVDKFSTTVRQRQEAGQNECREAH